MIDDLYLQAQHVLSSHQDDDDGTYAFLSFRSRGWEGEYRPNAMHMHDVQ